MMKKYQGFQGIDLTTAGHLANPREVFQITNELNKTRDEAHWIGIEIYPMIQRRLIPKKILARINSSLGRFGVFPQGISMEQLQEWQKEFPNTKIERIHLPFCADQKELWFRSFFGEMENGLSQMLETIPFIFFFGAASNERAIKMAQALGVGINAHVNVIEYFAQKNQLEKIHRNVPFILIESDINYHSLIVKERSRLYDPRVILKEYVGKYEFLDGFLLGLDHYSGSKNDLLSLLDEESMRENLYALHLAHPAGKGESSHDVVEPGDHEFAEFLKKASLTVFTRPVRVALDYNPLILGKLSFTQKLEFYAKTVDWIDKTQKV